MDLLNNYRRYSKEYKHRIFLKRNKEENFRFYLISISLIIFLSIGFTLVLIYREEIFNINDDLFYGLSASFIGFDIFIFIILVLKLFEEIKIMTLKKIIERLKKRNDFEELQNKINSKLFCIFAIEAIAEKYQEKSIDVLNITLKSNKCRFNRKRASFILAEMGIKNAIEVIKQALALEKRNGVKFYYAFQIAKLDKIKGIELMEKMHDEGILNEKRYNMYLEYFRKLLKDDVINKERLRNTLQIHDKEFMINFVEKIITEEESKFFDFKTIYAIWKKKPQNSTKKTLKELRREICLDIGSYANAEGGVIIIGISNKQPRVIIGLDNVETKKQSIIHIAKTYIEGNIDFFEIIDIRLKDDNQNDKTCILIVVAQTKKVVAIRTDKESYQYPLRVTADKIFKSFSDIEEMKKEVENTNYNFLNLFY